MSAPRCGDAPGRTGPPPGGRWVGGPLPALWRLGLALLLLAGAVPGALAQAGNVHDFQAIGTGPFEVPIAGRFAVSDDHGATVFSSAGNGREIRVVLFRNAAAAGGAGEMNRMEQVVQRNWQRLSEQQKLRTVEPFARTDLAAALALLSMASAYDEGGVAQYFLQYAVIDGRQMMYLTVEGTGSAAEVAREMSPLMLKVKVTNPPAPPPSASPPLPPASPPLPPASPPDLSPPADAPPLR